MPTSTWTTWMPIPSRNRPSRTPPTEAAGPTHGPGPNMPLKAEVIGRIAHVPAAEWDALDRSGHPFLKHAFLDALEATGCVGGETGWLPAHLVVRDEATERVVAAVPQYYKSHSWGEFVFDW